MIHKTKKKEGKKHITMPLRWEVQLFQLDSRPISACFGRQLIRPDMASRVGANPRKKKKKKAQTQHWRAGNRVGLECDTLPAVYMLSRIYATKLYRMGMVLRPSSLQGRDIVAQPINFSKLGTSSPITGCIPHQSSN